MSAVLAVVGPPVQALDDASLAEMLATMAWRGQERTALWRSERAALASARDVWEMDQDVAGPTLVASRGQCHAVCDATLYYVRDLRDRLEAAGVTPASDAAADLIVAAYLAFGAGCVDRLEGDFAFCVWDERSNTLFSARDPFGTRSLYHMEWEGAFFVASTTHALAQRQGSRAGFDARGVLRSLLVRPGDGADTAWRGIAELPAAHTLVVSPGGVEIARYWHAKASPEWARLDGADAAHALAGLLTAASRERQRGDGTALSMSGGMDSTAILASLDAVGAGSGTRPVDILSYELPEGDPGNEAWYVNRTAEAFDLPVHWLDVAGVGFFDSFDERARRRSDGQGHLFEGVNREAARAARALGDRVLLNGHGGDNLFATGDSAMADLFRTGRWLQLRRYFKDRGYRGLKDVLTYCLRPALPLGLFDLLEPVLGRHICSRPWEWPLPSWVTDHDGLVKEITVRDREVYFENVVRHVPTVNGRQRTWALTDSIFYRICALLYDLTRDEGMELRMPFFDRRLVEFALSRPVDELNQPRERKLVLKAAVTGRLPDRTREPQREGMKPGSFVGVMESRWGPEATALARRLSGEPWVIADELGLIDARGFEHVIEHRDPLWRSARDVSATLFAEGWLRAQRSWVPRGREGTAAAVPSPR